VRGKGEGVLIFELNISWRCWLLPLACSSRVISCRGLHGMRVQSNSHQFSHRLHPSSPAPVHFVIHHHPSPYNFLFLATHPRRKGSAHRGKWGQLTPPPGKMDKKLKSKTCKKERFSMFILYIESNQGRQV